MHQPPKQTPTVHPIFAACRENDLIKVMEAVAADKTCLNEKEMDGCTLLHVAPSATMVEYLLSMKLDLNARTIVSRETPLHVAAFKGNAQVVECLLAHGADVHAKDCSSAKPLMSACKSGNAKVVELLLAVDSDVNATDQYGESGLFQACLRGFVDTVKLLLDLKADPDVSISNRETCMHAVCRSSQITSSADRVAIVKLLLAAYPEPLHLVNFKNAEGRSPLLLALPRCPITARLLIQHGASVKVTDAFRRTSLHIACQTKGTPLELVQLLVESGANLDLRDRNDRTPLHNAVASNPSLVPYLLQQKPQLNNLVPTLVSLAIASASPEVVSLLLEAGAVPVESDLSRAIDMLSMGKEMEQTDASKHVLRLILLSHGGLMNARLVNHAYPPTADHQLYPTSVAILKRAPDALGVLLELGGVVNEEEAFFCFCHYSSHVTDATYLREVELWERMQCAGIVAQPRHLHRLRCDLCLFTVIFGYINWQMHAAQLAELLAWWHESERDWAWIATVLAEVPSSFWPPLASLCIALPIPSDASLEYAKAIVAHYALDICKQKLI